MHQEIYLDNGATTKPFDEVIELMGRVARENFGNPSSLHRKGIDAEKLVKQARETIANNLSVDSKEIYFTSGGTESNNLAINGYFEANRRKGKHIITTKIEHPSVLEVFNKLSENGYKVDFISVDSSGKINLEELRQKMDTDTSLLSIIYINNEVGSIQPIDEIIKIKNEINRDTVIHLDAVQAFGKIKILPKKSGIDILTFSSHKIHGPKGVGGIYIGKDIRIKPIIYGGGQESMLRSGTENVPGITGFGKACEIQFCNLEKAWKEIEELKTIFIQELKNTSLDFSINSVEYSSPYILNISFKDLRAEVLLHHLEEKNIYVSTGSACSSKKNSRSHVLQAMGKRGSEIEGAIRFSFSYLNSKQDILTTIEAINKIVPRIKIKKKTR